MNLVNAPVLMVEGQATLSRKGQVTIPASVRRLLKVGPFDKIIFGLDNGGYVRIIPAEVTLESAYGSVRPTHYPEDFKALSKAAKDDKAEQVIRGHPQGA